MTVSGQTRTIPDPVVHPDNASFWQAAREGKLLLKRCVDCEHVHWYPRPICPFCGSDHTEWIAAGGKGTVYAVSVTRKPEPAYAIAYVTLEEGVTMMTNIVDCDFDAIRIGDAVQVVFKDSEGGQPVPMFRPA